MEEVIRFALLGLGIGATYALASQGLIIVYRGSGVLNFALGAIGMAGAYVWWELTTNQGWAFLPGLVAGVLFAAVIGGLVHLLIMRPLRHSAPLVRVIATLGVLITIQSIAILRYTATSKFVPSDLPTDIVHIHNTIVISADRLILLGIACVLTLGLWLFYRYTRFGLATSAVAESERSASALGLSPDMVATLNWALGCGLAGLAAILIVPIVTLQPAVLTNLVLAATAAALVAGFRSFPIALVVGLIVGIAQTEVTRYVEQTGVGTAIPFVLIVIWLVIRGQALPLRDYLLQRLPTIGSGRINWPGVAIGTAVGAVLLSIMTPIWIDAITVTICIGVILLSIVVLTGYTGQLSLAQFAFAGFGAYVAGRLLATTGLPFWLGVVIGVVATVPLGVLFGLPAVRTRGINLAIVTLGLGSAIELVLFGNTDFTGGFGGTQIGEPTFLGLNLNAAAHPTRYGLMALILLVLVALVVGNLRRGRSGRRLIAVRTNERAAAALGISVPGAKLYAFGVAAGIAALGGILLAFRTTSINYAEFTSFTSITMVAYAMIGGIGYLFGPVIGATLAPGAFSERLLNSIDSGIGKYIPLIGGVSLIVLVLVNQNGVVKEQIAQIAWLRSKLGRMIPFLAPKEKAKRELPAPSRAENKVEPMTLEVKNLTVKYGGTTAVDDVSLTVKPGQVLGLIGPNGAGKTSLIDAVTGFTRMAPGSQLLLDGKDIGRISATKRSRLGLGRSFQSLELFEDSTVLDNLRAASDPRDFGSYARDLVWPVNAPLPDTVLATIREFELEDDLDRQVEDLPYGRRRLLAMARAVATESSVLLLDEPAAGLGDAETGELAHLVGRLAREWGIAVLVVEHDMNFVMSVCDELVVLDFGRTIATGKPAEVRRNPAVIAAYLGEEEDAHTKAASARSAPPRSILGTEGA
ncbi:MAG TPA: branched-chain amino acid ABC transporter permease/ATP-binding protein [Solirubrobacterales bacterium]|nr:branched-chain amino acid ABC transporter permease/ATP-binding protein [Solirubrobacterales bacterium]